MGCRSVISYLAALGCVTGAVVRQHSTSADDLPSCSCACCVTQSRGDGVRWGRQAQDSEYACQPLFYGQPNINEGFTTCPVVLTTGGQFCKKQKQDPILSTRTDQVDTARFCFYECMPSSTDKRNYANGMECLPASVDVLKQAGALDAWSTGDVDPGGGVDLTKAIETMQQKATSTTPAVASPPTLSDADSWGGAPAPGPAPGAVEVPLAISLAPAPEPSFFLQKARKHQ